MDEIGVAALNNLVEARQKAKPEQETESVEAARERTISGKRFCATDDIGNGLPRVEVNDLAGVALVQIIL